jgi:hypothetical protein
MSEKTVAMSEEKGVVVYIPIVVHGREKADNPGVYTNEASAVRALFDDLVEKEWFEVLRLQ